ncbi:hypothetical protein HZH66_006884 [Vespula vulgaris]|uniref:Uncharacterized protein n=1 Tax=Vespula vulgaris TaxID=7454 RepID=A0A834N7E1_VESVU|nr:hypothetical protein HZH66_006884 [Vespula vulgaris]
MEKDARVRNKTIHQPASSWYFSFEKDSPLCSIFLPWEAREIEVVKAQQAAWVLLSEVIEQRSFGSRASPFNINDSRWFYVRHLRKSSSSSVNGKRSLTKDIERLMANKQERARETNREKKKQRTR